MSSFLSSYVLYFIHFKPSPWGRSLVSPEGSMAQEKVENPWSSLTFLSSKWRNWHMGFFFFPKASWLSPARRDQNPQLLVPFQGSPHNAEPFNPYTHLLSAPNTWWLSKYCPPKARIWTCGTTPWPTDCPDFFSRWLDNFLPCNL